MFHLFQLAVEMRLSLRPKMVYKQTKAGLMRSSMVSSGIETDCCIVMASCYEKSNNFYSVVTFKFEIEKSHKRNWIKTCQFI